MKPIQSTLWCGRGGALALLLWPLLTPGAAGCSSSPDAEDSVMQSVQATPPAPDGTASMPAATASNSTPSTAAPTGPDPVGAATPSSDDADPGAAASDGDGGDAEGDADGAAPDDGDGAAGAAAEQPRQPLADIELETTLESPDVAPYFNVYRPADLDALEGPIPLVVWANGGCFRSDFTWEPVLSRWASAGFIVLALTASMADPFAAGALTQTTPEHHGAMIDWALEQADFADRLDVERIVAAGNSCGGITALALAAEDERVDAVFVLSGSSNIGAANLEVMEAISVPVGYVVGGPEDIAGANATSDYEAMGDGIPAMIVSRDSGDHVLVSTDVNVLSEVAGISLNWLDLAIYGTQAAYDALHADPPCEGCTAGDWSLTEKNLDALLQ